MQTKFYLRSVLMVSKLNGGLRILFVIFSSCVFLCFPWKGRPAAGCPETKETDRSPDPAGNG